MHNNETSILIDTLGSSHALRVQADLLVLDQRPVLAVRHQDSLEVFVTDEQEIACTPEACWYAIAGAGAVPTAAEVGRLLADHLARWTDEQRLRALVQSLSRLVGEQTSLLILPQPRLDSFIEAALARCEPTPTLAKVAALAQVIDQPPALVAAWLQQRGKTVLQPEEAPEASVEDNGQAPDMEAEKSETSTAKASRVMFRWTGELIEQLTTEFLATPLDQSISAAAKTIAARNRWPAESTEYKIYHLELPRQREAQRQGNTEPAGDEVRQVDDTTASSSAHEQAAALPVALATERRSERQTANALPAGPVELRRGNFVWDVQIDGAVQRWHLDYPYGSFPAQAGGEVLYGGTVYTLQVVGASTVRATSSAQMPALEETAEVLRVG